MSKKFVEGSDKVRRGLSGFKLEEVPLHGDGRDFLRAPNLQEGNRGRHNKS